MTYFDEDAYRDKQLNKYLDEQDAAGDLYERAEAQLDEEYSGALGDLLGEMISRLEYNYNFDYTDARAMVYQFVKDSM